MEFCCDHVSPARSLWRAVHRSVVLYHLEVPANALFSAARLSPSGGLGGTRNIPPYSCIQVKISFYQANVLNFYHGAAWQVGRGWSPGRTSVVRAVSCSSWAIGACHSTSDSIGQLLGRFWQVDHPSDCHSIATAVTAVIVLLQVYGPADFFYFYQTLHSSKRLADGFW